MKAIKTYAVPLAVGAAAALLAELALSPLWLHLGWRKPVADWMVAIGLPTTVAAYWAMVWINLPSWVVAVGAGLLAGTVRRQSPWFGFALLTCFSFIITPHLLTVIMLGYHPWSPFGPSVALQTFLWEAVAIPLLLLSAWLVRRRQPPTRTEGSEEAVPQTA